MREFRFDPLQPQPLVTALITGPKGTRRVRLILDTGCFITHLHTATANRLGYGPGSALRPLAAVGVGGKESEGYEIRSEKLFVLAAKLEGVRLGIFDLTHLMKDGIDGLLGWDVIRAFHLEMVGPTGLLKIF
jgi:hypothetical protein